MGYVHPLYGYIEDDDYDIDAAIDEQLERKEREADRREQELRDTLQRNLERHGPIQANADAYSEYIAGDRE
jgi:hypothetical protein